METPLFKGGLNIAIKIPKNRFEATLLFYRDILGFKIEKDEEGKQRESYFCEFGNNRLWFDMVENYSQTDVWLELKTSNIKQARKYLNDKGVCFRDELEAFPPDLNANWVSEPAGVVLLLNE